MAGAHHHPYVHGNVMTPRAGERTRLAWVMALTLLTAVVETVAGFMTGSLALLGDAFHMFTHFLAVALSYTAIRIALRPAPPNKTYRYWRVEVLAGLFNGMALVPISGYLLYQAYERWQNPVTIRAIPMLIVATIGLVENIVCAWLLHRHSKEDLNIRGAFLHMLADSASSVGVLVAGALVYYKDWRQADPLIAAIISLLILGWCFTLVRDSVRILLESVPAHLGLDEIRAAMNAIPGVLDIHDLHVWTITSRMYSLTAHVRVSGDLRIAQTEELGHELRHVLEDRYGINHATLQFEEADGSAGLCDHDHLPGAE